ncbi:hypothetical protein [Cupriavidus pauculus]|uniref:hypothetical protein n=1 Tax=Cupriavidus pauculus TaxID=82633 RepID=UPI0011AED476|nr:hypothetical protein [Cupriavidus pauculus]
MPLLLWSAGLASAQTRPDTKPHYHSRRELEVVAALSPRLDEMTLMQVATYCAEYGGPTARTVNVTMNEWRVRNGPQIAVATYYVGRLEHDAAHAEDEASRKSYRKILNGTPNTAKTIADQQIRYIEEARAQQGARAGEEVCLSYFKRVASGDSDIRQRDPELAAFLDEGIPKETAR